MLRAVVYLLFFLSGATALVYEVAWTRRLSLTLGSTNLAVSLILASWMLGLALGAGIAGRRADRVKNPLLAYAVLEGLIGVVALLFPLLLAAARGAALATGGSRTVAFLFCFLVLLLPTTLMGATLPLLSRFVVTRLGAMGGRIGLLYGLNTFGAVCGTFLSGFFLIRLIGVYGSTFLAAGANLAIAAVALFLALKRPAAVSPPVADPPEEGEPKGTLPLVALLAAFASGLLALASEVLWTRMLVFFLEGFTYTFSSMLTTFLLGLALGALVSGLIVNRVRDLRRYIGWLFLASAVVSAGVLWLLTHHFGVTNWAKDVTAGIFENWRVHHAASLFLASFVTLFPPALVMGGIFPAVARLATRHVGEVGEKVGRVYAVNTVGSVVGALLAGLLLVRFPGMAWGAGLVAVATAAVGLVVLRRRIWTALPAVAVTVLLVVLARPWTEFILHSHVFKGERALERELKTYEEGAYAAVSVVEDVRNGVRAVYTDEFQAAATGPQYKYMRMLAHLPLLVAPRGEGADVLVICFGTGTTAGSATAHPLGRLDLVEISREVLAQEGFFRDVNKGVVAPGAEHSFPVEVHVDDGRNFLLRSDRTWDVISLEPLMPYTPGAVNLYTEDFYRLCRDRLADDGLMCQWIPIHAMAIDDYKMLLRSFTEVFPETTLWLVEGTSLVIGRTEPGPIDLDRLVRRMEEPKVLEDLRAIEYGDPLLVLNTFVSGGEALRTALAGARVMTDERPHMEFRPVPFKWPNSFQADNLAFLHGLRRPVYPELDVGDLPEKKRKALEEALGRGYDGGQAFLVAEHKKSLSAFFGVVGDTDRQQRCYRDALRAYDEAVRLNPGDASARYLRDNALYGWLISLGMLDLGHGRLGEAERRFRQAVELENPFKRDVALTLLGKTLNRGGRYEAAAECLTAALEYYPRSPGALVERCLSRFRLGDIAGAVRDYELYEGAVEYLDERKRTRDLDAENLVVLKRLRARDDRGQLPDEAPEQGEMAAEIVKALRAAAPRDRSALMARLRVLHRAAPRAVRTALAEDAARSRDASLPREGQLFGLKVLVGLGDLPGTLDLLATGTPAVREAAADALGRVKRKEVVPALIEAMDDDELGVREASWAGLYVLTGRRPDGYDPKGPPASRREAVAQLRTWWTAAEKTFRFED